MGRQLLGFAEISFLRQDLELGQLPLHEVGSLPALGNHLRDLLETLLAGSQRLVGNAEQRLTARENVSCLDGRRKKGTRKLV